jgi:tetratricopeptide (TPR) repeat protein
MAVERALCPVLVGRDDQLTALEEALLATHRGEGQMVFLVGEAGIGKTRLAGELQRRALKHGTAVISGGCSEADLTLPYLPFIEAIGNYLAARDLDQLRVRLGPAGRELGLLFPQLEAVAQRGADDATERKLRLFESVLALLRIAAEERGLLVVLEDLHWADASTRELLDYVSRRLRTSRILVVATCRREELTQQNPLLPMLQGWRRAGVAQVLELGPLAPAGVGDMVEAILDQPVRGKFREFLYTRSEGNPFVVEEFLKAALDRVFHTGTGWDLKVMAELKIPSTVRDTILQRVGRLTQEQAEILSTAAVIGRAFSYPTLVAVSAHAPASVQAALRTFVQQQLMEEDPHHGDRYQFRHTLTHEAIYDDVIGPKRAELHGRAADAMRDEPLTEPMDLARHLLAAQRWDEAVPVCLRAAEEAERRSGHREVVGLYERVVPLLRDDLMRGRVLCRLGYARFLSGNPARAQSDLENGIDLLQQHGEAREAAGFRIHLGSCHAQQARPQLARAEWQRAREALQPEGPSEELAYACVHLASQLGNQWEMEAGLVLAQEALAVAEKAAADAPRLLAHGAMGIILTRIGRVAEGLEHVDKSYAEAMERGLIWIAGNALVNGVAARVEHFRAREAVPQLQLLRGMGSVHQLQAARAEGGIYAALGEPVNALRAWEEALALAQEREAGLFVRRSERGLAAAYAALGRFNEARALLFPSETERERQETFFDLGLTIRTLLDGGDVARALHESETVLASTDWGPLPGRRWLFDVAAEALLEVGRIGEARQLVDQVRGGEGSEWSNPYQARMEGRLALARDELALAHSLLAEAVEVWAAVGYREEESRTRRALAEVKARAPRRSCGVFSRTRRRTARCASGSVPAS